MKKEVYTKKEIYTVYAPFDDMTFIMCDTYNAEGIASKAVVGWYYGEPNEDSTNDFVGNLIATY